MAMRQPVTALLWALILPWFASSSLCCSAITSIDPTTAAGFAVGYHVLARRVVVAPTAIA